MASGLRLAVFGAELIDTAEEREAQYREVVAIHYLLGWHRQHL
jgi:hypothetical protein